MVEVAANENVAGPGQSHQQPRMSLGAARERQDDDPTVTKYVEIARGLLDLCRTQLTNPLDHQS